MNKLLQKAAIVVAHPDDEVLWFSSVLDKVDRTIMCFLKCESRPDWSIGRINSLNEYPLQNISCLSLDESEVFNDDNFYDPVITKHGIKIAYKNPSYKKYLKNFNKLYEDLKINLIDFENVFTHNPWGEYGNEEHVQVYRIVRNLKEELGFHLWFPNYVSNKSYKLMLKHISDASLEYVSLKTNKTLSEQIKKIYQTNGCWTWYDDWEWLDEESFIKDDLLKNGGSNFGHMFPLNMINVEIFYNLEKKSNSKRSISTVFKFKKKNINANIDR